MKKYIIKRLLIIIPELLFVALAVFTLLYLTPGDPAAYILGDTATEAELAEYRTFLGIDRPYMVQLGDYLYKLFITHDLGNSWVFKTNISDELAMRLPYSLTVGMFSIICGVLTGIPMGVAAAVKQDSLLDKTILVMTSVVHCVPNYVIALIFITVFSLHLRWLPPYGIGGIEYYIMPCACLLIGSFGGMARSMRSQMLEVIRSDYVTAARAQGFSKRNVNYRHALPNAMIPMVTQIGNSFATVLSGTIILETIFSIPGTGMYIQSAISKRDIPVIEGTVIFLAIWYCLVMAVVDILYAVVDPRIKSQYENANRGSFFKRRKMGRRKKNAC
ncbi:MAG: ABC transporter permease [Faecousia sp.]